MASTPLKMMTPALHRISVIAMIHITILPTASCGSGACSTGSATFGSECDIAPDDSKGTAVRSWPPPRRTRMAQRRFLLAEQDIPTHWYNIAADLERQPPPPLHPGTGQPVGPDDLAPLF